MYGLAKIQRGSKYPIARAPEYSRNLLSTYKAKPSLLKATRTTTWNLPGPSGTRDCIDIVEPVVLKKPSK